MNLFVRPRAALAALACASLLAACSGGGGGGNAEPADFTNFVQGLASQPSETGEPVSLEGKTFRFSEDPNAFDALFR